MSIEIRELPNRETGIPCMGLTMLSLERLALHNSAVGEGRRTYGRTIFSREEPIAWDVNDRSWRLKPVAGRVLAILAQAPVEPHKPSEIAQIMSNGFNVPIHKADSWTLSGIKVLYETGHLAVERTKFKNHRKISAVQLTCGLLVPEGLDEPPTSGNVDTTNISDFGIAHAVLYDAAVDSLVDSVAID